MVSISVGHQLYLYRLFSREVGIGKQVMLTRVEEVLVADDIWPSDLGCSTVRELLEQLSDFVRLTVFKRGRVYATVLPKPEWDDALAALANKKTEGGKGNTKSFKRRRAKNELKPVRPRPKGRPKPKQEAPEPAVESADKTASARVEAASKGRAKTTPASAPEDTPEVESVPKTESAPEAARADQTVTSAESAPAAKNKTEDNPAFMSSPEVKVEHTSVPAPAIGTKATPGPDEATPVHETVPALGPTDATHAPGPAASTPGHKADATPTSGPATPATKAERTPAVAAQVAPAHTPKANQGNAFQPSDTTPSSPTSQSQLPQQFATQVHVPNEHLSALYQILPLDMDPLVVLDEDWRVARSTDSFTVDSGTVSFDLRYLKAANGSPVRVLMRRSAARATGKRWVITSVDRIQDASLEGLPETGSKATRELAQFAKLGPWDDLVHELQKATAHTHLAMRPDELKDYLCITFCRIMRQRKLVVFDNDAMACFNTGLVTDQGRYVLTFLAAHAGDIPWRFINFATDEDPRMGDAKPLPPTYVTDVRGVALADNASVCVSAALLRTYGQDLAHEVDVAVKRTLADYRLATPAYDPLTDEVRLLLPVRNPDGKTMAAVLRPQEEGFVVSSLLAREEAATHARIVSRELPRWLAKPYE